MSCELGIWRQTGLERGDTEGTQLVEAVGDKGGTRRKVDPL